MDEKMVWIEWMESAHTYFHRRAYKRECKFWHKHKREHQAFTRTFITYVDIVRTHTIQLVFGYAKAQKIQRRSKAQLSKCIQFHAMCRALLPTYSTKCIQCAQHTLIHTRTYNESNVQESVHSRCAKKHETEKGKINVRQIKAKQREAKQSSVQLFVATDRVWQKQYL